MVELSCCDRFTIFMATYVISTISMPIFAIAKPIYLLLLAIRNAMKPRNTPERHAEKVKYVQQQVKDWNAKGRKTKMCTARPGWLMLTPRVPVYKNSMTGIHVDMGEIIEIDTVRRVIRLEPLMNMGRLSSILIPMGWTLPVVPELDDLTIGGLVCGAGIETSSHKYGLIHNICVSMEVVVSSGEVLTCSKEENSDLFYAMAGSHGTLGFLTAVEVRIIPAKKYMRLEYIPTHSLDETISTFESQTYRESGNDYVEGILFSLDKGVIMVGNMSDEGEPGKVNSIGRWYKPWFYKHVETYLKKSPSGEYIEYIPLRDYFHRHTKCLFWETANFIPYGNNVIFRFFFGWILPLKVFMIKLALPERVRDVFYKSHVLQDYIVPIDKLRASLLITHEEMQIYPIWLCPAKLINDGPSPARFLSDEDEMYVDFGVYGMTKLKEFEWVKSYRRLELFCIENRGYQSTYSDVCMTKEEFGQMFDATHYLNVREQFNCEDAFPDMYEKVCRAARR